MQDTNWHQVDFVKVGADMGLYYDGVFVATNTISPAVSLTGSLYIGQIGSSSQWWDGRISDAFMVNQNLYGVDPTDSGSTVPVRTNYMKLIYGA